MRRTSKRSYLLIVAILMLLLSLSPDSADRCRSTLAASLTPLWNFLNTQAISWQPIPTAMKKAVARDNRRAVTAREEIHLLEQENRALRERLREIQTLALSEEKLAQELSHEPALDVAQQRRRQERTRILTMHLDSMPARVIYRSPAAWNSTVWLNVGETDNQALGRVVVAKDSPVVVGDSVIGLVDSVGNRQCRVRLITDSSLTPSVRVLRKGQLLAKGELHGSGLPLWRREGRTLQGVGFNYDFADQEGSARDLRSDIIQTGDLLVTTGMDGVFPPGLAVAQVTALQPLREGDYFYELEAMPSAGDLDELWLVSVLPPVTRWE